MGGRSAFNLLGDVLILDTGSDTVTFEIESNEDFIEF